MRENVGNIRGITLVALVVTVIVLIILAGITLTLVLGQNGIIGKAQQAKEVSANADKETAAGLNSLYNEMLAEIDGKQGQITIESAKDEELSDTDNIPIKDDEGNTITIPAGFHIEKNSPTKQEDGIVVEDKDGNQFVWIPVADISNYERTDFGSYFDTEGYSSETMPSDEQASINKYHGYYIGRYETGDREATVNKVMRSSSVITDTVTIKRGQAPYNYVTRDQAKTLAEEMKTAEGYKATTKLCSSYAWDTAINFIQKTISNYGTSSNQGNYGDTTFNYIDIAGVSQTKTINSSVLIPTGQTTQICSIYDMGGNDWEWTIEDYNDDRRQCVCRGGGYNNSPNASFSSGSRYWDSTVRSSDDIGFRTTLYM